MKCLLLTLLLSAGAASAASRTLHCVGTYNSELIIDTEVNLLDSERNKLFADFGPFQFLLSANRDGKVELQSYNREDPSRSYATATMTAPGSSVELSIWTREYLMEVRCSL